VELLGRYSNQDIVTRLRQINTCEECDQLPARPTRSIRQSQRRLSLDEIESLLEAYRAGTYIDKIAGQFGIHPTTVWAIVKRQGLPSRVRVIDRNLPEARQLYEQGWSTARIGKHFGVAGDTVRRVLTKAGSPCASRGNAGVDPRSWTRVVVTHAAVDAA
jgi:hypothetical protein